MANRYRNDSEFTRDPAYRGSGQQEQFEADRNYQPGESRHRGEWRGRSSGSSSDRWGNAELMRSESTYRADYHPLDDYDRASFGSQARYEQFGQTHGYFRPDDFGGEDYTRGTYSTYGAGHPYRGYGYRGDTAGSYGSSNYAGTQHDYNRDYRQHDSDRGFFERASDEIASWFGDEEAERRRRMDHRGRGPANYKRSKERLLEDACERLTHDPMIDASNINVTAEDNEITLDGTVTSRMQKRRAEDCVHDIAGVKHVQNNLRITESEQWSMKQGQTGSTNKN